MGGRERAGERGNEKPEVEGRLIDGGSNRR